MPRARANKLQNELAQLYYALLAFPNCSLPGALNQITICKAPLKIFNISD